MRFAYLCPIHKKDDGHRERLETLPDIFFEYSGRNHIEAQNKLLDFAAEEGFDAVKIIHSSDHCIHQYYMFDFAYENNVVVISNWFGTTDGYIRDMFSIFKSCDDRVRKIEKNHLMLGLGGVRGPAIGTPSNWWLPRKVIEEVRFDESMVYWTDVDFINQCAEKVDIVHAATSMVQILIDNKDSASEKYAGRKAEDLERLKEKWKISS